MWSYCWSLARAVRDKRFALIDSAFTLSVSTENTHRLFTILGLPDNVDWVFLPHSAMEQLAITAQRALSVRTPLGTGKHISYESARLEQLQLMFTSALKRGVGVAVTKVESVPARARGKEAANRHPS